MTKVIDELSNDVDSAIRVLWAIKKKLADAKREVEFKNSKEVTYVEMDPPYV